MDEMTHDRCSELLRDYARGDLDRALHDEVAGHLAGCAECRAEELAVTALAVAPEPMDDVERARLHRAIEREISVAPANADVAGAGSPDRPWKRWAAPALGAAAAALVIGLVLSSGGVQVGGGDEEAGSGGSQFSAPEPGAAEDRDRGGGAGGGGRTRRGAPVAESEQALELSGGGADGLGDGALPAPQFDDSAGEISRDDLSRIGRTGDLFRGFSLSYNAKDAPDVAGEYLDELARDAGDAEDQVRGCGATVPQDGTIIPTYGALGTYEGDDVLVLGFVTSSDGRRLDRYLMWIWPRGSCEQPIDTLFEQIDR